MFLIVFVEDVVSPVGLTGDTEELLASVRQQRGRTAPAEGWGAWARRILGL